MLAFAPEHGQLLKAKEAKAPTALKSHQKIHHFYMLEYQIIINNPTVSPTIQRNKNKPQETLQVDLWALCDFWSSFRRKKRSMAAIPWI